MTLVLQIAIGVAGGIALLFLLVVVGRGILALWDSLPSNSRSGGRPGDPGVEMLRGIAESYRKTHPPLSLRERIIERHTEIWGKYRRR